MVILDLFDPLSDLYPKLAEIEEIKEVRETQVAAIESNLALPVLSVIEESNVASAYADGQVHSRKVRLRIVLYIAIGTDYTELIRRVNAVLVAAGYNKKDVGRDIVKPEFTGKTYIYEGVIRT